MIYKIRRARLSISYSIFWIFVSALILFLALFPRLAIMFAELLGVLSSVNFIFLVMLFILLAHNFFVTIKLSNLENKLKKIVEEYAVKEKMDMDDLEDNNE